MRIKISIGDNGFEADLDSPLVRDAMQRWFAALPGRTDNALKAVAAKIDAGADAVDAAGKKLDDIGQP